MSFGYGIGDFLAISKLALAVYNVYKDAPDEFKNISDEIKSLHIIIDQHKERELPPEQQQKLGELLHGCENVLKDLDKLMKKYQGLGASQGPRTIDRFKWDPKEVTNLRDRLISNTNLLSTFLSG